MGMFADGGQRAPVLEVQAAAEGATPTRENHHFAGVIESDLVQRRVKVTNQFEIDGVEPLGPGKDDPSDSLRRMLDLDGGHGTPPIAISLTELCNLVKVIR